MHNLMIRAWLTLVISATALSAACLVMCVEANGAIYQPTLQPWVPGAPVSTFGDGGTARLEPPKGGPTSGAQIAVDPAGRVLVSTRGKEEEGFLTRLLADGTIDPRFGQGGRLDPPGGRWNDLVIDPEGRILLAGSVKGDLAVARLMPDGGLDPTFGTFGVARVHLGPPTLEGFVDETLEQLVVLPDGSLLGAGWATPCAEACRSTSGAVIKLTPDGVLDTSFGEGGYDLLYRAPRPEPGHGKGVLRRIFALAVQPDGKILIGGNDYRLIVVVRLTASGAVDRSFGNRGAFFTTRETVGEEDSGDLFELGSATSILVKPTGQIVVVGARFIYGLRPNGHIDPGFNPPGGGNFLGLASVSPEGGPSSSSDALLDADGRIVVVGWLYGGPAVRRLLPNGNSDPRFGGGSMVSVSLDRRPAPDWDFSESLTSVALLPDGNLVAAGHAFSVATKEESPFVVSLNDTDGSFARCDGARADYQGTPWSDSVSIWGDVTTFAGNDVIAEGGGSVCAGPGDDRVRDRSTYGGAILLGPGDDVAIRDTGRILGGPGDDSIEAPSYLEGWPFDVDGGPGRDKLLGSEEADRLEGGSGDDVLTGGPGDDVLVGGSGDDVLVGGPGHDVLISGSGHDRIIPGPKAPEPEASEPD
jgi:uncharacterized delta-60 repeat protein